MQLTSGVSQNHNWFTKIVRGNLNIRRTDSETALPTEGQDVAAVNAYVFIQINIEYYWIDHATCDLRVIWDLYTYDAAQNILMPYTILNSNSKFKNSFGNPATQGLRIHDLSTSGYNHFINTDKTLDWDNNSNPIEAKLTNIDQNQNLKLSFSYSNIESNIEYFVTIPEFSLMRPTKYSNNLVFNQEGLKDFVNQIHEYPKTFFGVNSSNIAYANKSSIAVGNVPIKIHNKWYGIPVQGLTTTGTVFNITAKYAMYDDSELANPSGQNNLPVKISDKYVTSADFTDRINSITTTINNNMPTITFTYWNSFNPQS